MEMFGTNAVREASNKHFIFSLLYTSPVVFISAFKEKWVTVWLCTVPKVMCVTVVTES
jgi:hypothetical protein